jgi:hypothetical protein
MVRNVINEIMVTNVVNKNGKGWENIKEKMYIIKKETT